MKIDQEVLSAVQKVDRTYHYSHTVKFKAIAGVEQEACPVVFPEYILVRDAS
ncbi:MAG: hypothetical protein HXS52_06590 [Theionarchaea archaeon]|nr:hypothetical protein [Theionarchaea archaeon]MBU7037581.1 hypothetical protein [Theionarchaea archaeon]